MRRFKATALALVLAVLLSGTLLAASAKVALNVADKQGAPVSGALFMFTMVDDAEQTFSVDENDAGIYEATVTLPSGESAWTLSRVVAAGYLPVRVSIRVQAGKGDPVQEITEMELNPGVPIPPIQLVPKATATIDLTLGDQREVMAAFVAARAAARAKAEEEEAARLAAAPKGPFTDALRLYSEGDLEGALPHFREAAAQQPDNVEVHVTYAQVLYKAKRWDEFEPAARKALGIDTGNGELWMMLYSSQREREDLGAALGTLLEIKGLGGGKDLLPHLTFIAQSLGTTPASVPAHEAILDLDAGNFDSTVALATIYAKQGDFDRSESYIERAIGIRPEQAPNLYFDLATRLLSPRSVQPARLQRGIGLLEKVVGLQPGHAPAWRRLGLARWQREDHQGALDAFNRYMELEPNAEDKDQVAEYLKDLELALSGISSK